MPEKNNPAPQDGPAALEDACWDPDWMIWNAKSLQHVVKELDRNGLESPQLNTLLFEGKFLAGPILLTLAIQIALKAWLCLERKEAPPRTHDVLKLFKNWPRTLKNCSGPRCQGGLGFERLPTNTDHCLSFCIRTGMHTHTGGISTKNTGGCFEARNSTERLR